MKTKAISIITVLAFSGLLVVWTILTVWTEAKGPPKSIDLGNGKKQVLIVYDPDPICNLDEKVCVTFGKALAKRGIKVKVATVSAADKLNAADFEAYVFCANTYNWRPDRAVTGFIEKTSITDKPVIAITLGSGSTESSQKALEKLILKKKGKLVGSRSFWLLRPNDELRMEESNVKVALSMVDEWAKSALP
ncbi:hypothetical protein [Runella sp.]|uniref:hypothetical protein n=1 Tax=Runella sp. TaxID=1960881 RepID=UPI003D153100